MASFGSRRPAARTGAGAGSGVRSEPTQPPSEKAGTGRDAAERRRHPAVGGGREEERAGGRAQAVHDGNLQLNNGLFAKAAENYKQALTHWDHPAIHYNLALALMNLDQPIESQSNFQMAMKFGDAPLVEGQVRPREGLHPAARRSRSARSRSRARRPAPRSRSTARKCSPRPARGRGKVRAGKHTIVGDARGYTDARRRAVHRARRAVPDRAQALHDRGADPLPHAVGRDVDAVRGDRRRRR